jgi:hypothetical protein
MNPHIDYFARCLDSAIYIGLGIAMVLIVPGQLKRKVEAGKMTEEKAKKASKVILPCGIIAIAYGGFRIFLG